MLDNITSMLKDTKIKGFALIKYLCKLDLWNENNKFQISLIIICGTFITLLGFLPGRFDETYVAIITFLEHYILQRQAPAFPGNLQLW